MKSTQPPQVVQLGKIPPKSRSITSIGDETANAAAELFGEDSLFHLNDDGIDMDPLTEAFKQKRWSDKEAAKVIRALGAFAKEERKLMIGSLARWAHHHPDDSELVIECLTTEPPPEIEIIKVLSLKGSQKVVFLATWRLTQAEIVLKKVIANTDASERILSRELRANPLNMVHPNVIETQVFKNHRNEAFLVEKKLQVVLSDDWRSHGTHEAANLLFDIGNALKFLHDKNLIHGDVKPDNLGKRGDSYILLDFGICREREAYTPDATPTGSLRTRAPELLTGTHLTTPEMIDVWALGATVYNSIKGRFPLVNEKEIIPRVSVPKDREMFEKLLKARVEKEWDKWVSFDGIPESIATILKPMLSRDPASRLPARDVSARAQAELAAFIRQDSVRGAAAARYSPVEELHQLQQYLNSVPNMRGLLPLTKRKTIHDRLTELKRAHGFGDEDRAVIQGLTLLVD